MKTFLILIILKFGIIYDFIVRYPLRKDTARRVLNDINNNIIDNPTTV